MLARLRLAFLFPLSWALVVLAGCAACRRCPSGTSSSGAHRHPDDDARPHRRGQPRQAGPGRIGISPAADRRLRVRRAPRPRARAPSARSTSSTTSCSATASACASCASCATRRGAACACACSSTISTPPARTSCCRSFAALAERARCACSTRCRCAAARCRRALSLVAAPTSGASTIACTTSCSSPTTAFAVVGRPQHGRRVLHAQRGGQLHRHGRDRRRPGRARAVGGVRPLLEQRARLARSKPSSPLRSARRGAAAASTRWCEAPRPSLRPRPAIALGRAAGRHRARRRPGRRSPSRAPRSSPTRRPRSTARDRSDNVATVARSTLEAIGGRARGADRLAVLHPRPDRHGDDAGGTRARHPDRRS